MMNDTPAMSILDRLRSAETGSRELDVEIWFELVEPRYLWAKDREGYWSVNRAGTVMTPIWQSDTPLRHAPDYTTSIDAALALVDKMLPDGRWRVEKCAVPFLHPGCAYWASAGLAGEQEATYAATPALAILTALLTALAAKEA